MHDAIRSLMLTPPPTFVAARNDAVKELRREGERDLAEQLAKLRRPAWTDHALNVVAETQPAVVDAFVAAAVTMRSAQQGVLDGDADGSLAHAMRSLRVAQAQLVDVANRVLDQAGRKPDAGALAERLAAVAASGTLADQLQHAILGFIGADEDATSSWFSDTSTTTTPRRTEPTQTDSASGGEPDATEKGRLYAELDAAQKTHRDAKRAARAADKAGAAAGKTLERARSAAEQAAAELAAARAAAEQADAALAAASADAEAARRDGELAHTHVDDAAAAVEAARRAIDQAD